MRALLLRCYPARWRRRYGDEFQSLLDERPLGPFDVLDVLLGALDAHLHLRGLGAASDHEKGFAMSRRTGGYAAIAGSLTWFAGFLANAFDGSAEAWPTAGIILAGTLLLLVGIAGLSAYQARERPALVWAAFLVPLAGGLAMVAGFVAMGLARDEPILGGLGGWGIGMIGLLALLVGSGLFAYASWRTGHGSAGSVLLGITALLAIPTTVFLLGFQPWEPLAPIVMLVTLATFAGGWLLVGIHAVRVDRPSLVTSGGAA